MTTDTGLQDQRGRASASSPDDLRLDGRVVAVTGASRGLGRLLAGTLAQAGAHVVLMARDRQALDAAMTDLRRQQCAATTAPCDVTDEDSLTAAFDSVAEQLGGIDAVIANAGVSPATRRGHNLPLEAWQQALDVNLTGPFLTARAAYPHLACSGHGRLVLTSSTMARLPRPGLSAYAASKAGLEGLARALAVDWAPDRVCVNVVAPGFFDIGLGRAFSDQPELRRQVTDRTLVGDIGAPAEAAGIFRFLVSVSAAYVTGQTFMVDGGYGMR